MGAPCETLPECPEAEFGFAQVLEELVVEADGNEVLLRADSFPLATDDKAARADSFSLATLIGLGTQGAGAL